jgi:fructosamine-3-kinase
VTGVAAAVAAAVGGVAAGWRVVPGGDVNRAACLTLAGGREVFVKHRPRPPAGMYAAEARGLAWLAEAGALRVPAVLAVSDDWLALEWVPPGAPAPGHDEALGRGLAAMHRAGAPGFGGPAETGFVGPLEVPDAPAPDWPAFLGERRLLPLARRARDAGLLDGGDVRRAEALAARLPDLCGPPEPPSRLHGDLWAGNAHPDAAGAPVLVDPAAYGGHREIDLALMRLFGGFGPAVFAAYGEAHPLAPGHADRVELFQLPPVLVHVVLFGGAYVASARRILRRYAGGPAGGGGPGVG